MAPQFRLWAPVLAALLAPALTLALVPCTSDHDDWHKESIALPKLTCENPDNNVCSSCDLWNSYKGKTNLVGSPPILYYTGDSSSDHRLVVPTKPCQGVESTKILDPGTCGGEQIWDVAWSAVPNTAEYGLAVNPTFRRGMHQLHIHAAKVQRNFQKLLADEVVTNPGTPVKISCTSPDASQCKKDASGPITATYVPGKTKPSELQPFARDLGTPFAKKCNAVLITQPKGANGFVVVTAPDRAAECFLYCSSECASTKCTSAAKPCS